MASAPVVPADLSRLSDITTLRPAPDGSRCLAVTRRPDVTANAYRHQLVELDPAGEQEPRVLLETDHPPLPGVAAGRLVAVLRDERGWGVQTRHDDGWNAVLTGWPDPIEELAISPDGARAAFVVREPQDRDYWQTPEDRRPPLRLTTLGFRFDGIGVTAGRPRQVFVLDLATGAVERLSEGGYDDSDVAWHPDGQSLYFVSQRQEGRDRTPRNDVFRVVPGQAPEQLTDTAYELHHPTPSPDGTRLAVGVTDVDAYPCATHLGILDLGDGSLRTTEKSLDRDVSADTALWRGDRVLVVAASGGRTTVVSCDAADPGGSAPDDLTPGDHQVSAFCPSGAGLVHAVASFTRPPRVLAGETVLLDPQGSYADERALPEPQHVAVSNDGVDVDAWVVLPDGPGPHPLVLSLQGGGGQMGSQWSHEQLTLVGAGYAVMFVNARGSSGYGTAWMRTVCGPRSATPGTGWGTVDVADCAAAVRATLAAHPQLDPARVGVMGGSYGGLVTTQLLAQTDLFAAGWAERGPYNLLSDAATKDEAPWFFQAYLGGSHLEDPDSYWDASPLRRVEQITSPLMIVHSEQDYRCEVSQAEELFFALKLLDRDVELVRFPGEGHNLTRSGSPVHRAQRLDLLLEWFGGRLAAPASTGG